MENTRGCSRGEKIVFGLSILLAFNASWGVTAEITKFLYGHKTHSKPFMCTYIKTSMLSLYLFGVLICPTLRRRCTFRKHSYSQLNSVCDDENITQEAENSPLSSPIFVPINLDETPPVSLVESSEIDDNNRAVHFNTLAEVRHMSDNDATDALLARLSYHASLRADVLIKESVHNLPIARMAKLAFIFTPIWFVADYNYHIALIGLDTEILTVFLSSASVFTMLLAAGFPSSSIDKFSLSKCFAVISNFVGLTLLTFTNITNELHIPVASLLSVFSALFYSIYIVFLRRQITQEDYNNIPILLGFIGAFTMLLVWPFFLILHYNQLETFEWPNRHELLYIVLFNGVLNTLIFHFMWLWACFLTSSLMGVVAMGSAVPLSVLPDILSNDFSFSLLFRLSVVPILGGSIMMAFLVYHEKSDPIGTWLYWCYTNLCRRGIRLSRFRFSKPSEQTESLINVNVSEHEA